MFAPVFVVFLSGLSYCSGEGDPSSLGIPLLSGPSEALVKKAVEFGCVVPNPPQNESIHLAIYKVGNRDNVFGETIYQPDDETTIPKMIKLSHEGYLECVAAPLNASSSNITATVSRPHYLKVIEPVAGAEVDHSGPLESFEGNTLELLCLLTAGNHVTYKWLRDGRVIPESPRHHVTTERLRIFRTTSADSGSYMCLATNTFNNTQVFTSNSSEVVITVKDLVSDPEISFTVLKENSQNYSALVSCQSAGGATPVTFSLYNRTEFLTNVTVDERQASFRVPLVMSQHLGWLQCQAHNGGPIAHSQWLPLHVVPVNGPAVMHHDKVIGENYAVVGVRFYCRAAEGTHPRYQWFLNRTLLENRGSFHYVVDQPPERSVLLLSVGRNSAGTYHCQVSDSFDNTTVFSSRRRYVDKEVLNQLPILVVYVVFGCFTILVFLVSVCCCTGVVYRRQTYGNKSLLKLEMERKIAVYEGEMDLSDYTEDPDEEETAKKDEFDQASEASVEDWPPIKEELKKTLEDETL